MKKALLLFTHGVAAEPVVVVQCAYRHAVRPGELRCGRCSWVSRTIRDCAGARRPGGLQMANKTFVEKAAEKVGYGLAMAEELAGAVRTTEAGALKQSPAREEAKAVRKAPATAPA